MILLTGPEIKERWLEGYKEQNLTDDEYDLDNLRNNLHFEDMHALEAVARAQLKKVYELVSPYLYDTRGGWILESLKKEVGG